jgi:hypothetical protein
MLDELPRNINMTERKTEITPAQRINILEKKIESLIRTNNKDTMLMRQALQDVLIKAMPDSYFTGKILNEEHTLLAAVEQFLEMK